MAVSDILRAMRKVLVLAGLSVLVAAVGCTGDVRPAIRQGEAAAPVADTGFIASSTTGGDAAGTLNLDANQQTAAEQGAPRRGRRGGRGG